MRILLFVLFLSACCNIKEEQLIIPAHSKKVVARLMDSLGTVTLYIPERFDTSFTWIHWSDNSPSDLTKCRFQSKKDVIFKESGFFYEMREDSVDQLTISYPAHLSEIKDGHTAWIRQMNEQFRIFSATEGRKADEILIDTSFTVRDRLFSVTGTRFYARAIKRTLYELNAVTAVRGLPIKFEFKIIQQGEYLISEKFVSDAIDVIKTIGFSTHI
ncbi:hypothetical protein SAMN05428949_6608 [Chitinophaga sp. YR627]|uniref:hypothetical protein n=1 Tax=Chitinophaga sp. YR627 TaxID=1881041 RepID=UPI0008EFB9F3|nr:hypothetical protein [Chitinophaga sp. YR627]SFO77983.1 hypothetical protein SAMN05428949_6608 [Chitinophaga sp. YR627]